MNETRNWNGWNHKCVQHFRWENMVEGHPLETGGITRKRVLKHYRKGVCVESKLIWTGSRNCPMTVCEGTLLILLPDNIQHLHETDIYAPGGIRTYNPNKRAATNPRLRLRGHWDRLLIKYTYMGSYRLDTRICSRECVWGWVWRVNIITVLRVNMLHCTFIKGKIIVVDNWRGRDRMEGFYYWSVQMMSSEHLSTIVFRIKGFSTYCSKALLVEWTSCFVWTAFCCHIICILSSVQNSRQCKSFFLSVVLLVA